MGDVLHQYRQLICLCFGLAFLKAGFFTYAFTEGIFPYLAAGELMISLPTIISYAALSLALLLVALMGKVIGALEDRPVAAVASTVIVVLGTVLGLFSRDPFGLDACSILSAICVGGASGVMFVIWGEMLSRFSYHLIKILVGITLIITFVLYLLVLVAPLPISSALIVVFPLISGLCMVPLVRSSNSGCTELEEGEETEGLVKLSPSYKKWIALLGIPHFVLSVVNVALWSLSNVVAGTDPLTFLLLAFAGGTAFAVFLFLLVLNNEGRLQVSSLTQYAIPLLIVAPVLIVLAGGFYPLVVLSFMFVCSTIVFADFLNWILFCELAREEPEKKTAIVAFGRFFIYSGMLSGCLIGRFLVHVFERGMADSSWTVLLCVVVIVLVALMVFVNAVEQYRVDVIFRDFARKASRESALNDCLLEQVKASYGLTPREYEVMLLLYEGLTAPQIQTRLVISLNTVNSHMKRIYKKLGVHNRVELYNKIKEAPMD